MEDSEEFIEFEKYHKLEKFRKKSIQKINIKYAENQVIEEEIITPIDTIHKQKSGYRNLKKISSTIHNNNSESRKKNNQNNKRLNMNRRKSVQRSEFLIIVQNEKENSEKVRSFIMNDDEKQDKDEKQN